MLGAGFEAWLNPRRTDFGVRRAWSVMHWNERVAMAAPRTADECEARIGPAPVPCSLTLKLSTADGLVCTSDRALAVLLVRLVAGTG